MRQITFEYKFELGQKVYIKFVGEGVYDGIITDVSYDLKDNIVRYLVKLNDNQHIIKSHYFKEEKIKLKPEELF